MQAQSGVVRLLCPPIIKNMSMTKLSIFHIHDYGLFRATKLDYWGDTDEGVKASLDTLEVEQKEDALRSEFSRNGTDS